MKQARHCFISESGELLARWQEAFPKASSIRFDQGMPVQPAPTLLWVRLPQGRPVANVLADIRRIHGNLPCIILSDLPDDDQAVYRGIEVAITAFALITASNNKFSLDGLLFGKKCCAKSAE